MAATEGTTKEALLKRLKRIEKQIRKLQIIVEEEGAIEDIFALHTTIANSLEKMKSEVVDAEIEECFQSESLDIKELLKSLRLSR